MVAKRTRFGVGFAGLIKTGLMALAIQEGSLSMVAAQTPAGPKLPQPTRPAVAGPRAPVAPVENLAPVRPAGKPVGALAGNVKDFKVMAVVNGEQISKAELGKECLRRYGKEVLESMLNRRLIQQACQEAQIEITEADLDAEVKRIASRFSLPVERWIELLQEERNVSIKQYRHEIIWPTLALKRLAADQIEVTPEEMNTAFESEYGPRVRVRLITTDREATAREVQAKAMANPESFPELAKKYCLDPNIASVGGAIPPIRRHLGDPNLEATAFALKEGEVSKVIKVDTQYVVLLCEGHDQARPPQAAVRKAVEETLADRIRDTKLRGASQKIFAELQKNAEVVNVYNNPAQQKQNPGVAALINGRPITIAQLTDECIARHGATVLEGEINRKLLSQELTKKNLVVKQEDLDAEVGEAALMYNVVKPDGSPDIEKWLKQVEEQDGATIDLYIRDAVWPSVALKKLAASKVKVTEDDMKKGFEANYGPRVECLAIVVGSQRQAQQIWEHARQTPTDDFFGKLAAEHSIEPVSRGNAGKVPPVRKNGGQPIVEEEAFKLKKGELSSILAVGDKWIILRCLGRTQPVVQKMEDIRKDLEADIYDKLLNVAMTQEFDRIREHSQIDNFLVPSLQVPKRGGQQTSNPATSGANPAARVGALPGSKGK